MARRRRLKGKRLLIASAGLATLSYVGCGEEEAPPGNLVAPPPPEEVAPPGNLVPPPPREEPQEPEEPDGPQVPEEEAPEEPAEEEAAAPTE